MPLCTLVWLPIIYRDKEEVHMCDKKSAPPIAFIESHVHDQGGGASWCSACNGEIDIFKIADFGYICPGCGSKLQFGKTTIQHGGSDF